MFLGVASRLPIFLDGLNRLRDGAQIGRTLMAKGQKRTNRVAKKPAAGKKKVLASDGSVPSVLAKPKSGGATAGSKK